MLRLHLVCFGVLCVSCAEAAVCTSTAAGSAEHRISTGLRCRDPTRREETTRYEGRVLQLQWVSVHPSTGVAICFHTAASPTAARTSSLAVPTCNSGACSWTPGPAVPGVTQSQALHSPSATVTHTALMQKQLYPLASEVYSLFAAQQQQLLGVKLLLSLLPCHVKTNYHAPALSRQNKPPPCRLQVTAPSRWRRRSSSSCSTSSR